MAIGVMMQWKGRNIKSRIFFFNCPERQSKNAIKLTLDWAWWRYFNSGIRVEPTSVVLKNSLWKRYFFASVDECIRAKNATTRVKVTVSWSTRLKTSRVISRVYKIVSNVMNRRKSAQCILFRCLPLAKT